MKERAALWQVRWTPALQALLLLLGGGLGLASLSLAAQHPVMPLAAPAAILLLVLSVTARPQVLWFLLPAALPVMSFTPWTGWWLFDESDLLVSACLGGAFLRWAIDLRLTPMAAHTPWRKKFLLLWSVLAVSLLVGVSRGLGDAGAQWTGLPTWNEALYAGYDSPWNTWRVAKSLIWALLIGLLLQAPGTARRQTPPILVAQGMVAGLATVCLMVLWERWVYVGLGDFSRAYRTSAWFWEMHVGGGAIDAYLAMAVPFAAWAIWSSPSAWRWAGANILMMLSIYAVLTTYSRGVYLAVLISLLLLWITAWRFKLTPAAGPIWRRRSLVAMASTLVLESALVLGGGTFMADRLGQSDTDLTGRMEHWRSSLGLLQSPSAWLTGLGVGRFPAHYSRKVDGGNYPGEARWQEDPMGSGHVLLSASRDKGQRADVFALTQRVDLAHAANIRLRMRADVQRSATLLASLCERHLLYDFSCQRRWISLEPLSDTGSGWIEVEMGKSILLEGRGGAASLRESVLALSPVPDDPVIRIDAVELWGSTGQQHLLNGDFSRGLQHWLPIAQSKFQPWHVDNLYLDVLVERGLLGMVVLGTWVLWALHGLWARCRRGDSVAWVLLASVVGISSLGAVISVTEVPRVNLILMLLLWSSAGFRGQIEGVSRCNRL